MGKRWADGSEAMNAAEELKRHSYLIQLPKREDERGNLSFIEEKATVPFAIQRAYWIYDVPGGQERPGHAYWTNEEFVVAISGSFEVMVNDGDQERIYNLNRSYFGLYIPNRTWRQIQNFSTNSLCLVLCSTPYSRGDYIESRSQYLEILKS